MIKVGERLGRFELLRELGRGSHGVVFEARDTLLNELIAIKTLNPWLSGDPTLRERFKRELILTRRVSHPGVCRLHDLHEEDGTLFISMQLVDGRSLSQLLRDDAPSLRRVIQLLRGVCGALAAAHEQGVVHRDLKPANVMVDAKDHVMVLDFGIATAAGVGQLTRPGQALGSVPFIPPEVWEGQPASQLGDQYAVGIIGFAAATGTLPYRGVNPLEVADAIKGAQPTLRERWADVDPAFERVILRCMARKPEDRFADIKAVDEALAQLDPASSSLPPGGALPQPATVQSDPEEAASSPEALQNAVNPNLTVEDMEPITMHTGIIDVTPSRPAMQSAAERPQPEMTVRVLRPDFLTDMGPRLERQAATAAGEVTSPVPVSPASSFADDLGEPTLPPNHTPLYAAAVAAVVLLVIVIAVVAGSGDDAPPNPDQIAAVGGDAVVPTDAPLMTDAGAGVGELAVVPDVAVVVADAGEIPDFVDAGAVPDSAPPDTAPDLVAGSADAGIAEPVADLDSLDAPPPTTVRTPKTTPTTPTTPTTKPSKPTTASKPSEAPAIAVALAARARGIRPGDVPALDQALQRARRAADKSGVEKGAAQARAVLDGVVVDKAFVGKKLARFNTAFDAAPPPVQARVKPMSKEVVVRFAKGDWATANARLNDAFDAMKKK